MIHNIMDLYTHLQKIFDLKYFHRYNIYPHLLYCSHDMNMRLDYICLLPILLFVKLLALAYLENNFVIVIILNQ